MKKRIPLIIAAAILPLFAGLFFFLYRNNDTLRFQKLSEEIFAQSLSQDSLSLHYTLAEPSPYLKAPSPATLPAYSRESQKEAAALLENQLLVLQEINPEKLNSHDRYTWSLLTSYLENELAGARCEYYEEPLAPSSGMQSQLPVLLAEYTFLTKSDMEDYLEILESIPAYLESLAVYEKEKANAGLFMTEADAGEIVDQCDAIMAPDLLSAGEHFLQTTFQERLDGLVEDGQLKPEEEEFYISENNRLLTTVVSPAYTALADSIFLLSGSGSHNGGLCELPSGISYYLYLLRRNTGSSRTPEEIQSLLSDQFQNLYQNLQALVQTYREQTGTGTITLEDLPAFPFQNAQEILDDLQIRMQADFPALAALTDSLPSCRTKSVAESMEDFTSPAFYLTPPIDDMDDNVIYVNNSSTSPGLELYTTLAHEGYPGHLYQTVYSQLYENSKTDNPVRSALFYGGFVEGWAYYVENIAYGYASDVLLQNGAPNASSLLTDIACLERNLQVNLYCLLDLSIHYYGASRQDVYRSLAAFGISDQATADAIYDYIRTEPTTYLKYYLGYLEILALRDKATDLWGDDYTPLRFHTFLLQAGPSDFTSLEKKLAETPAVKTTLSYMETEKKLARG